MTAIGLFGAGGKMGYRLADNLKGSRFDVRHVEVSDTGRRLADDLGIETIDQARALVGAEVAILAVPDTLVGKVASAIGSFAAGTIVVVLDAAAPCRAPAGAAGPHLFRHPPLPSADLRRRDRDRGEDGPFRRRRGEAAHRRRSVQGPESAYALGEEVAKIIWKPVMRSHSVTVEQMALLEPSLSETVCASLLDVMREATDEVVSRGVPADAARDVLLWKRVFEPDEIAATIRRIT